MSTDARQNLVGLSDDVLLDERGEALLTATDDEGGGTNGGPYEPKTPPPGSTN